MELSVRMQGAIAARETLGNDFFGGWVPADIELFRKYHMEIECKPGYISDYFGVRTRTDNVPWAAALDGQLLIEPPIPDDGVRAEAIEYYALLDSLDHSTAETYTMVELGASYAPWGALAGVLATRLGKQVSIRAVEASAYFHARIADNFADNGLVAGNGPNRNIDLQAIHGAVGIRKGSTSFPVIKNSFQNGGQATLNPESDYTSKGIDHEKVPVCTLDEIFQGLETVDFLHSDIQGSEADVLLHGASQIGQKVRRMFIGTHSRKIEGDLLDCYHKHGWQLIRDRPVTFTHQTNQTSLVGMTTRDGGQYWVNGRL
jgi:FkbM family methyltransferase